MFDTTSRYLSTISDALTSRAIRVPINSLVDRYSSQALNSAGLVINAGGAAFPKIGAADFYAVAQGILVKIAAGTAMPALTGITALAGGFVLACFFVDSAGVVTVAGGAPAATLGGAGWPQFPRGKALVGFLAITNAGAFVGGTTALDTATTVYFSPPGAFDPTVLV
jgi:hypothetical protein